MIKQEHLGTRLGKINSGSPTTSDMYVVFIDQGDLVLKYKRERLVLCSYDIYFNGKKGDKAVWGAFSLAGSRAEQSAEDLNQLLANANLNKDIQSKFQNMTLTVDEPGFISMAIGQ
jgi:hypothetical protein